MKLWALLAASLLLSCALVAQDSDQESRGPDGGTRVRVEGIQVLPLTGKPFSGRSTTEWTRTLEDGTVVSTHLFAMVARDSQGRIYRERRHFVPTDSNQQSALTHILFFDPLTQTRTECSVATHLCDVTGYHAPTTFTPPPVGPIGDGTSFRGRDNLGDDIIDGLKVIGTRDTITLNAGVVGNSQPLVSTREFWYSPDLQINLAVTRKDPRQGTQVIRVGELSRAEPDPALFKVPAGFRIEGVRSSADPQQGTPIPAGDTSTARVSPDVLRGLLISRVAPEYPELARQLRIQGQVVLSVLIDKSGTIKDIHTITSPDKSLTDSAVSAVTQWHYRPYLLNGNPVEVQSTVLVNYTLQPASRSTPR